MWCEITIQCKKDLPRDLGTALEERLGTSDDKRAALDAINWSRSYDLIAQVVYARLGPNGKVFLIQSPDLSSLKIHTESVIANSDIRVLRDAVEDVLFMVKKFLKAHKNRCIEAKALVHAEGAFLQTGKLVSRREMFRSAIKKNVLLEVYIPASTLVASFVLDYDLPQSAMNLLASATAVCLWFIIQVALYERKMVYAED